VCPFVVVIVVIVCSVNKLIFFSHVSFVRSFVRFYLPCWWTCYVDAMVRCVMERPPAKKFPTFRFDEIDTGFVPLAFLNNTQYVARRHDELKRMIVEDEVSYPPHEETSR
jgi:hypothetical protein